MMIDNIIQTIVNSYTMVATFLRIIRDCESYGFLRKHLGACWHSCLLTDLFLNLDTLKTKSGIRIEI